MTSLVKCCREGDKEAWDELVYRITPLIFSICGKMSLSREESFDIFGQVAYLLLKNLANIKSSSSLLSYISTMTKREIYAISRRDKLYRRIEKEVAADMKDNFAEPPDAIYDASRRTETLLKALATLPSRDYELIKALFLDPEEPSYEEISKRLDIPVSSIGPYRARCLAKLQKALKEKIFRY